MAEVTGMTPDRISQEITNATTDLQSHVDSNLLKKADISYADSKSWIKRNLIKGEDINNITEPGIYATILGSIMSSLVNRPFGFTGPGHIRVTTSGSTIFQEVTQHTSRGTETAKRQTTGGVFGEWETTEAKTRKLHYTDYNDIPEGYFDIGRFADVRDMVNRPPDVPASALVITKRIGDERMYQLIIGTDANGVASKWERRKSAAGEWSEWTRVHTDISRSDVEQMISDNSGIVIDNDKVVTVGDSQVGAEYAWANLLSGVSGQSVINMGASGYTPDESLMQSGVRNMVTTSAVTLPYREDVPVTVVEPPVVAKNRSRAWSGKIDGKSVDFKYSDDLKSFTLRNQENTTIEVPVGSTWVSNSQGIHPDHRRIVWFGGNSIRNNMSQPWETPAEHVMRAYSDAITAWGDTTVVCGYVPAYSDVSGRDAANELNTWLLRVVPTQFLDIRYRLQLASPDILGRELTTSEKQDIADGYLPRPLYRSDLIHLTDETHVKIAEIISEFPHGASPQVSMLSKPSPVMSLAGMGFPEGKVTAPVGSIYTDSEATNGAIRWIKASGTGNTGWRVEYGDTGWRDVTSLLMNGWTAQQVLLRRHGSAVTLSTLGLSPNEATTGLFISLPSSFHNAVTHITITTPSGPRTAYWNRSLGLTMTQYESIDVNNYASAITTWQLTPTTSWPNSLPGTPS